MSRLWFINVGVRKALRVCDHSRKAIPEEMPQVCVLVLRRVPGMEQGLNGESLSS